MTESLGRKTTLTIALILIALGLIFGPVLLNKKPFRMGLDLQGGTRLVYKFDFERALAEGQISASDFAHKEDLLQEFKTIIHERVDPKGVLNLSIRSEGLDRIVIELPGAAELATSQVFGKLATAIPADAVALTLDGSDPQVVKAFGQTGGIVRIDSEKITYAARSAFALVALKRGAEGTSPAPHEAGAQIELLSSDDLQKRIENVGDMQFLLRATPEKLRTLGTDEPTEQKKLDAWRKTNPNTPIEEFNRLTVDQGGPAKDVRWHPMRPANDEVEQAYALRKMIPLVVPRPTGADANPDAWFFTGSDLDNVGISSDNYGHPAVSFETAADKKGAFGDFTERNINEGMAIVLNGEIATLAKINSRLPGGGIIEGGPRGFKLKEVQDLVTVLRSGSLRVKPELMDRARVGASMGEDYIKSSLISGSVAMGIVVLFMVVIYRRLGLFSVIGLAVNLTLLMGIMALWGATITLPGIAGIVLTVGMAVDGNILIFERLREEQERGLKLTQAAKAAFERAAVTIIDSNVTTLIAGVILYWAGTGPIRGFATTLSVGILTTLFTVIIGSEVLVFHDIKRGAKPYRMREIVKDTTINFMGAAKYAVTASVLFIVAGCVLFIALPEKDKLGIDFLGGFAATVRTQEPQTIVGMRELIAKIPGTLGKAEVKEISESGSAKEGYRAWRITSKLNEAQGAGDEGAKAAERELSRALGAVLQKEAVVVTLTPGDAGVMKLTGELYLESVHPINDVQAALADVKIQAAAVEPLAGHPNAFALSGTVGTDRTQDALAAEIRRRFEGHKDSVGTPYSLLSPIPESAVVGSEVGGELRDKAIRAMILALFATMLYLRVRFAEWSYGIAVVASLIHDVLLTIGALAIGTKFGFVQSEVDLTMIAAFLTIIGYSQNDTIVTFDRVRELLPRSKKSLKEVLNDAINQCLRRTILTTSTVFLTILVLFLFNFGSRNVIEGFSYALLVGVLTGAYSTVYIAGPTLLWLENYNEKRRARMELQAEAKPAS